MAQFATVNQAVENVNKVGEYINAGMETAIDVSLDFVQHDKDNDEEKTKELKDMMLTYAKMERDMNQFLEAVNFVKTEARRGEVEDMEALLNEKLQAIQSKNNDGDLEKHEKYKDMIQQIFDVQHPDENFPSQTQTQATGDEDIEFTQEEVSTICPFTRMEMKNPMKNKACGHSYDKESAKQLIKNRGNKAKCPVTGCPNRKPLVMSDLTENTELRRLIERKNRQPKRKIKRN